jgi:dihydrofolate reductase
LKIKTHLGISIDGFIASADGWPAQVTMPDFASGTSHGHPEFIAGCAAALMGRSTFEPALGAPTWPWPGLRVFVLTSRPLPGSAHAGVVTAPTPQELLGEMQAADLDGDVHLVGGQRTVDAFRSIEAIDSLGFVVLPIILGQGVPFSLPGGAQSRLQLESTRTFPDGSVEHTYTPATRYWSGHPRVWLRLRLAFCRWARLACRHVE